MGATYLITGGAGNLACQLTSELAVRGHRIILFDRAVQPVAPIAPGCHYVRGDVTDREAVTSLFRDHHPQVVLHFASLLSGSSEADRKAAWEVNLEAAFWLFELALAEGVEKVFFPSSLAAYGGRLPRPLPEDHPQWPDGLYGVAKMAVERLGHYYRRRHGLDFRCLRIPVVLSPYAPPGAASAYASRAFVEAAQCGRFTFRVRPETAPASVYVKDVLRAVVSLVETPAERLTRAAYNIQGFAPSAGELAAAIKARLPETEITFDPDPQVVALVESWPEEIVDASARRDWGWQPEYDLDTAADDFIEELRRGLADAPRV